jgi:hypothetical protein
MADQFTSMSILFSDMQLVICALGEMAAKNDPKLVLNELQETLQITETIHCCLAQRYIAMSGRILLVPPNTQQRAVLDSIVSVFEKISW